MSRGGGNPLRAIEAREALATVHLHATFCRILIGHYSNPVKVIRTSAAIESATVSHSGGESSQNIRKALSDYSFRPRRRAQNATNAAPAPPKGRDKPT